MKHKFIALLLSAWLSLCFGASNTDAKIKSQQQDLASSKKLEAGISKKLEDIANDIKNGVNELEGIANKIEKLKTQISNLQESSRQAKDDLSALNEQNRGLVISQKQMQDRLVKIIAQDFSFDLLLSSQGESEESILAAQAVKKLSQILKDDLSKLAKYYDETSNIIKQKSQKIDNIQKSLNEFEQKKLDLIALQERQKNTISNLKKDQVSYLKRLEEIKAQQEQMRQTLSELAIIADKEKEAAKKAKQAKNNAKNSKQATKQGYTSTGVKKYKGAKTFAPLDSFTVKQRFGNYTDPIYNIKIFNESVILSSNIPGAKVKAVLEGKVVLAKRTSLLNNVVIIENSAGIHTIYANLSQISPTIKVGEVVKQGYIIGRVDSDLTFEVTQENYHIDPLELISLK